MSAPRQEVPGSETRPDWAGWIRQAGRQVRRAREFLGLSQEQLARLAGVSQGAVSRVEAGRGMATPVLTFLKMHLVFVQMIRQIDPDLLTDDMRCMLAVSSQISPPVQEGVGINFFPVMRDAGLERIIHRYRMLPERDRQGFLSVLDAAVSSFSGSAAPESHAR